MSPRKEAEPEWISIQELAGRIGMSNEGVYRQERCDI